VGVGVAPGVADVDGSGLTADPPPPHAASAAAQAIAPSHPDKYFADDVFKRITLAMSA